MIKYKKEVKHHFKMSTKDLIKIVKIMRRIIEDGDFLSKEETEDLQVLEKNISAYLRETT